MDSLKSVFNLFAVGGNRHWVPLITEIRCILSFVQVLQQGIVLSRDG